MRDSLFEVDPELKVPKFFPIFCVEDTPSRFIKQINFPLRCEVAMGIRLKQVLCDLLQSQLISSLKKNLKNSFWANNANNMMSQ